MPACFRDGVVERMLHSEERGCTLSRFPCDSLSFWQTPPFPWVSLSPVGVVTGRIRNATENEPNKGLLCSHNKKP